MSTLSTLSYEELAEKQDYLRNLAETLYQLEYDLLKARKSSVAVRSYTESGKEISIYKTQGHLRKCRDAMSKLVRRRGEIPSLTDAQRDELLDDLYGELAVTHYNLAYHTPDKTMLPDGLLAQFEKVKSRFYDMADRFNDKGFAWSAQDVLINQQIDPTLKLAQLSIAPQQRQMTFMTYIPSFSVLSTSFGSPPLVTGGQAALPPTVDSPI